VIASASSPASRTIARMRGSTVARANSALTKAAVMAGLVLLTTFVVLGSGALSDTAFGAAAPALRASAAESTSSPATSPSAFAGRVAETGATANKAAPSAKAVLAAKATAAGMSSTPTWHGSPASKGQLGSSVASSTSSSSALAAAGAGPLTAQIVADGSITLVSSTGKTFSTAAVRAINVCNGTDNVGGQAVTCTVTITNNLNLTTGVTSSVTTVKECHGAAGAALPCTTTTTPSAQLATSVVQCDGSGSGGGGTVFCAVTIVNNITGTATATGATVNQCNASGTGGGIQPTVLCDPTENTTDATVTQCNGSGNGGGGSIRVQCTVTPSTSTSALPVTIDQCNGSGNGGGALVICSASIRNLIAASGSGTTGGTTGGSTAGGTIRLDTARTPTGITTTVTGRLPGTPFAFTGAHSVAMALVALLAVVVGGLLILLSGQRMTRPSRQDG
jgi:hypothetical protein